MKTKVKTAESAPLILAAPAKLNLYLHVTGRRDDGYHLLDSLIAFADWHDTVRLTPAADISLCVDGPMADSVPAGRENLAFKAAEMMRRAFDVSTGCAVHLTKRLPAAAGIGGGSSDAAAVMRGLAQAWSIPSDGGALFKIAEKLGADVPMCLNARAAFAGGAGEDLTPAPQLPEAALVLVNPGVPAATADVFKARAGAYSKPARFDGPVPDAAALAALLSGRGNDLTNAAETLAPETADARRALEAQPDVLLARMSGSGAACFGMFADTAQAEAAARVIAAAHPAWSVRAARLVNDAAALAPDLD